MAAQRIQAISDEVLLASLRAGDETALVALYRGCRSMVLAWVLRNSGSRDDAEDLLQEAVIVLWERVRADRFVLDARLETFVMAVVKNLWLRRLSRRRRETPGDLPGDLADDAPSALDALADEEGAHAISRALDRLGDPCRKLLLLFYYEERSMQEIARELGFANAETAKAKKYQCRKRLETMIMNDGTVLPGR